MLSILLNGSRGPVKSGPFHFSTFSKVHRRCSLSPQRDSYLRLVRVGRTFSTETSSTESPIAPPLPSILSSKLKVLRQPSTSGHPTPPPAETDNGNSTGSESSSLLPNKNILIELRATLVQALNAPIQPDSPTSEPIVALYSPFEGGDAHGYGSVALGHVADEIGAEVVNVDVLGVLGGGSMVEGLESSNKFFPTSSNHPLKLSVERDDGMSSPPPNAYSQYLKRISNISSQINNGLAANSSFPPTNNVNLNSTLDGSREDAREVRAESDEEFRKRFFTEIVNVKESPTSAPRIIFVQNSSLLYGHLELFLSPLLEAVAERRNHHPSNKTIVVLSVTPSVLQITKEIKEVKSNGMLPDILMMAGVNKAKPRYNLMGSAAEAEKSWRENLIHSRIEAMERSDWSELVPSLIHVKKNGGNAVDPAVFNPFGGRNPFAPAEQFEQEGDDVSDEAFEGGFEEEDEFEDDHDHEKAESHQPQPLPGDSNTAFPSQPAPKPQPIPSTCWKVVGIIPMKRDPALEKKARVDLRMRLNEILLQKAVSEAGGEITTSTPTAGTDEFLNSILSDEHKVPRFALSHGILSWSKAVQIAGVAVGTSLYNSRASSVEVSSIASAPTIQWSDLLDSVKILTSQFKRKNKPRSFYGIIGITPVQAPPTEGDGKTNGGGLDEVDQVVENIRKSGDLTKHEQHFLQCIVDRSKMEQGFKDVHLPWQSVDSLRSTVTLPLLFPDAFATGLLKTQRTGGVLLFGPPGTGKTLAVRALARESGARMIKVTPADLHQMYVGESEKMAAGLFSLARRIAPVVIFIDEAEGILSKRGGDSTSKWQASVMGGIMQEMDGLTSASANSEKGVVVVGATNRPMDLDEAVLRRLPRRIHIDLPDIKAREAILRLLLRDETLAPDVDIPHLAKVTELYSGSDLRHLCVTAAMTAFKESVVLPWPTGPEPEDIKPNSIEPVAEDVKLVSDVQRIPLKLSEESPTPPTSPTASSPLPPPLPDVQQQIPLPSPHDSQFLEDIQTPITVNARPGGDDSPVLTGSTSTDGTSKSSEVALTLNVSPRVITKAHLDKALKESSASMTESQGILKELRAWNQKYGDYGSKKGIKKKGYGTSFGFTIPKPLKEDNTKTA